MNIETLNDYLLSFKAQVVESGFRRDVADFSSSLPNIEGNIIALRDVAQNVHKALERIHLGELPEYLEKLFPEGNPKSFTFSNYHEQLSLLMADKTIEQNKFFSRLNSILSQLNGDLKTNLAEVDRIAEFIGPYVRSSQQKLAAEDKAVFSIIFKDQATISRLNDFTQTLNAWNKVLPIYHQLVTNKSPSPVQIVTVQNGSIDFVVNLDVNVAVDLAKLFKIGLIAYTAYLAQKKLLLPIAAGYFGNPRLKQLDQEKEKVLLENIGQAVANEAEAQHKKAKPGSSGIDNPHKAIDMIQKLVTAHIVRGNDVKILALPFQQEGTSDDGAPSDSNLVQQSLGEASTNAKAALRELPPGSTQLLLEYYGGIGSSEPTEQQTTKTKRKK